MNLRFCLMMLMSALVNTSALAEVISYEFDIDTKVVNFTGEDTVALAVGGSIPGPTIKATVGDTLRVTFHNKLDGEASIHWHGILLPHEQDGVPVLNTVPIPGHTSHTFAFPVTHPGTYWYHSHTGLQEQRGVYGSIVLNPKDGDPYKPTYDQVVVFSDWTDENPEDVLANLKKDGDYYALKKGSVQSWDKIILAGPSAIKKRLSDSWTRMGPMDISDIGYDAFLTNGQQTSSFMAHTGETARLRMINASASSYMVVEFAGGPMTIIAADGMDIEPLPVQRLNIALAETYDVLVTLPAMKSYELRATSLDGTGYSSTFIGMGPKVTAPDIPRPNLLTMEHDHDAMGDMENDMMDHSKMDHSAPELTPDPMPEAMDHSQHSMASPIPASSKTPKVLPLLESYTPLRAPQSTRLPASMPRRNVELKLTGNMERFVWSFNNKTLSEADKILIRKGEAVRFQLVNETMMDHPIHLHGHFFRVLNGQGDYSPLKHTVNVPAMGEITIELAANEEKDWFFHCHNLYHMKGGMARVISYEGSSLYDEEMRDAIAMDNHWYRAAELRALTHMVDGAWRVSNTRNAFEVEFDSDYDSSYDIDAVYERSLSRFLEIYAGVNSERDEHGDETKVIAGVKYVLPLLIESDLRVDQDGKLRLGLESELQLTKRTRLDWMWNTDEEYRIALGYEVNKRLRLLANTDSDFEAGIGFEIRF